MSPSAKKKKPTEHLRSVWPLLQDLVRPRRKLIGIGFLQMIVNRAISPLVGQLQPPVVGVIR